MTTTNKSLTGPSAASAVPKDQSANEAHVLGFLAELKQRSIREYFAMAKELGMPVSEGAEERLLSINRSTIVVDITDPEDERRFLQQIRLEEQSSANRKAHTTAPSNQ